MKTTKKVWLRLIKYRGKEYISAILDKSPVEMKFSYTFEGKKHTAPIFDERYVQGILSY